MCELESLPLDGIVQRSNEEIVNDTMKINIRSSTTTSGTNINSKILEVNNQPVIT